MQASTHQRLERRAGAPVKRQKSACLAGCRSSDLGPLDDKDVDPAATEELGRARADYASAVIIPACVHVALSVGLPSEARTRELCHGKTAELPIMAARFTHFQPQTSNNEPTGCSSGRPVRYRHGFPGTLSHGTKQRVRPSIN